MKNTKALFLFISIIIVGFNLNAQLKKKQVERLNELVASWHSPMQPGGVVGIMKQGKILYVKPFGLASLDYNVLNTDTTLFNIGSISKQFTAMGIIRLQHEGKLSIDDDIRKYLPEIPDFGHLITIRHLMHHTSGLRSMHAILELAGWRSGDPRSNSDLFELMKRQNDLNNIPGERYIYSNTNYIFMALIIERVTGVSFGKWMNDNLFIPLKLNHTYVEANATNVVKGNATSYRMQSDNTFHRAVEYWNYTGSGNVHTTVEDLLLWFDKFSNAEKEWVKSFELIQTTDLLNDGSNLNYAFGVSIDEINGVKRISHGGSVGAFRSFAGTYPDIATSIVVLTNSSNGDPYSKFKSVSEIFVPKLKEKNTNDQREFENLKEILNDNLAKYEGDYWYEHQKTHRKIYLKRDTLWYYRGPSNESPMQCVGDHEFLIMPEALWKIKFHFEKDSIVSMLVSSGRQFNIFEPIKTVQVDNNYLTEFEGSYYSPELETYYKIRIQGDTLFAFHPRHGNLKMNALVKKDQFTGDRPLQELIFKRDSTQKVIGLFVSNYRVKNLWLKRIY